MKKVLLLGLLTVMVSCTDQNKRLNHLKSLYPNCKVEPATGLIKQSGYDFITIDSTNQMIAIRFYPFSETKIADLRNVR